jgi:hypothetical protein
VSSLTSTNRPNRSVHGYQEEVVQRGAYAVLHHGGELPDSGGVAGGFLQQVEVDGERDKLLLGSVVQVSFDLAPFSRTSPRGRR